MSTSRPSLNLVRIAGLVTWLVSGAPVMVALVPQLDALGWRAVVWFGAFAIFGVAFWRASSEGVEARADDGHVGLLVAESLAALSMFAMFCTWFESALLVIVAAQLGLVLGLKLGAAWILAQSLVLGWLALSHWPAGQATSWATLLLSLQATAYLMAAMVARQVRHRQELAQTNAELRATRELLAETSRAAERLRIARDLHDLVGHHLAALSLNLEVASHLTEGKANESVVRSRDIAKKLLHEVRQTVSELREDHPIDVAEALRQLVADIDSPQIHLEIPDVVEVEDPACANAAVRCVQEVITNTIRHSGAHNLWLEVRKEETGLSIRARDDGKGTQSLQEGNGLAGMRERLEMIGGRLNIDTQRAQGFELRAWMPLVEAI